MTLTAIRIDPDVARRHELGSFLRSRRERLGPDDLGLPTYGRRRTPGLRREEVAQLAGVGVTWYTWLEQGRDINVSAQVLSALATTLRFDRHERSHLMALAGVPDPGASQSCARVTDAARAVLAQLEPAPAMIMNARRDLLAHNAAYRLVFPVLDDAPIEDHNLLVLVFLYPQWRASMPDWEHTVPRLVAQFRSAMAEHLAEPGWTTLLERMLAESPDFAALWERHDVLGPETGCKRFLRPETGMLRFDFTHLWLDQRLGTRMTVYTPADDVTRAAMARLSARVPAGVLVG